MTLARLTYRVTQFWKFLGSRPSALRLESARGLLSAPQMELFGRMQSSEQVHSLEVMEKLRSQGETDTDLLAAALLHDIGKIRFPLHILERVWIVIVKAVNPQLARRWGDVTIGEAVPRWRRAFLVAARHPEWGAEMVMAAGASPRLAALIRRHQEEMALEYVSAEDRLLRRLQAADNES